MSRDVLLFVERYQLVPLRAAMLVVRLAGLVVASGGGVANIYRCGYRLRPKLKLQMDSRIRIDGNLGCRIEFG